MNLPATLSVTAAFVDLLFALLVFRISRGPGWREMRWFAVCALFAAGFSAFDAVVPMQVPPAVTVWASRGSLACACLHTVAWYGYFAAQRRTPWRTWERAVVALALAFAVLAAIPNVSEKDVIVERVAFGSVYRDTEPTTVGIVCYVFIFVAIVALIARYALQLRAGVLGAGAHVAGLSLLTAAGVSDIFASSGITSAPYVLPVGFLALTVFVGAALTSRFVESARALDRAAERLRATQDQLVKRERLAAIGELSAVVAHEVRNPVGVIFNALATLRKRPRDSSDHDALLDIVQEEAERLKRMVADLLEFAKPRELHLEGARVEKLASGAVEAVTLVHDGGRDEVKLESDADLPEVRCDVQLVHQAVINLVTNALLTEGRRGPVRVLVKRAPAGRVEVRVVDDGVGVSEEVAERMFTPFFTTRAQGTGLGLSVVRRIADAHGGEVRHEQTPGGGATFILSLPQEPSRASLTEASAA